LELLADVAELLKVCRAEALALDGRLGALSPAPALHESVIDPWWRSL
jgi:hypothetical protein